MTDEAIGNLLGIVFMVFMGTLFLGSACLLLVGVRALQRRQGQKAWLFLLGAAIPGLLFALIWDVVIGKVW